MRYLISLRYDDGMAAKTKASFYHVWPTAWGPMGAVAGSSGICRVVLPHYQPDALKELLAWEHPGTLPDPAPFEELIALSREYFNGQAVDFGQIACNLPRPSTFAGAVLGGCRKIPFAQRCSYLDLAKKISRPDAARAVAAALGKNPTPLLVPCHRVTYADGRAGGFSVQGGEKLKERLLALEAKAS